LQIKISIEEAFVNESSESLVLSKSTVLRQQLEGNLKKLMSELVAEGDIVMIFDPSLTDVGLSLEMHFK
jgi:hypothetical protein